MKKLLLLCGLISVISCNKENKIQRSFCYWKTTYNSYNSINYKKEDSLGVSHIYMRLFDVDWNPYELKPLPVATLWDFIDSDNSREITPSIYITNDVLLNSDKNQLDALARNIGKRITVIVDRTRKEIGKVAVPKYEIEDGPLRDSCIAEETRVFDGRIKEVLIDCDWTGKSRNNYFYLLERIKKEIPQYKIAATIRLWQYRDYKKAGVPPVGKGLLMCYNMGDPTNANTDNSIGSSKMLKKYVNHSDYPIKLDVALPIFSWDLVFRGKEFKGILNPDYFKTDTARFRKTREDHYTFVHDIVLGQTYYREGDEVRVEKVSDKELRDMIEILKDNLDLEDARVTFFSWDDNYIEQYGTKKISAYYSLFSR